MKKSSICLLMCMLPILSISAQETFSKFNFSGYRVVIVPSDTFRVDVINKFEAKQEVTKDGIFTLMVLDQTGQVPKDTVYVYTNKLEYLNIHNSELVMSSPIKSDSLEVGLACAFGELLVDSEYFKITAGAGARFTVKGETTVLDCGVGAASHIGLRNLKAKKAIVDLMGHSGLTINAEEVTIKRVEKSSFVNVYKP